MSDDDRDYHRRQGPGRPPTSQEEAKRNSKSIFVGGIPYDWDEKDLDDCFGRFGRLERITVTFDRHTGKNRGFAFVSFAHRRDAEDAFDEFDGNVVDGRRLRLDWDPGLEYKRGSGYGRRTPPRRNSHRSYSRSRSRSPRRPISRDRSYRSPPRSNFRDRSPDIARSSLDRGRSPDRRRSSLDRGRSSDRRRTSLDREKSPDQRRISLDRDRSPGHGRISLDRDRSPDRTRISLDRDRSPDRGSISLDRDRSKSPGRDQERERSVDNKSPSR